jgi:hypothetical protein
MMATELYRYRFGNLPIAEVQASLALSFVAAESLHGEAQVRLDAAHAFDAEARRCVIHAGTRVGQDINRLFIGFLRREFPERSFHVERIVHAASMKEAA